MTNFDFSMSTLAYAYGKPGIVAGFRSCPEDFLVDEVLPFVPDGEGDHALIKVSKKGCNTDWVARQLLRHAGVRSQDVGYAGLKDRHAVATQWFSVDLSRQPEPDWRELESDELKILEVHRHRRKLRRGVLRGNQFRLTLRNIEGDEEQLEKKLHIIRKSGVPNYFGEQRFGRDCKNLLEADRLLKGKSGKKAGRHKRGLYYSAARSWIFNQVLSERIQRGCWDQAMVGDVMMLDGTVSIFTLDHVDDEIRRRVQEIDIHPTGPLCGKGSGDGLRPVKGECAELEDSICDQFRDWVEGLVSAGVKSARRSLRLLPADLKWKFTEGQDLILDFFLPKGSYATSIIRELVSPSL